MLESDNGMNIGMGDGVNKALFLVITIFRSLMLFNSIITILAFLSAIGLNNHTNSAFLCAIGLKNIIINDSISYNYVVENEYSIIKHSGKVALQRVPRFTCVSVQTSLYKILQGTLQS